MELLFMANIIIIINYYHYIDDKICKHLIILFKTLLCLGLDGRVFFLNEYLIRPESLIKKNNYKFN